MNSTFVRLVFPLFLLLTCQGCLFITPEVYEWSVETREDRQVRQFSVESIQHAAEDGRDLRLLVQGRYEGGEVRSYAVTLPRGAAPAVMSEYGADQGQAYDPMFLAEWGPIGAFQVPEGESTEPESLKKLQEPVWSNTGPPVRVDVRRCSEKAFLKQFEGALIPVMHVADPGTPLDGDVLAVPGQLAVIEGKHLRLLFHDSRSGTARHVSRMDDWVHTPMEPMEYAAHGALVGTVAVTETVVMTGLVVVGGSILLAGGLVYIAIAAPLGAL